MGIPERLHNFPRGNKQVSRESAAKRRRINKYNACALHVGTSITPWITLSEFELVSCAPASVRTSYMDSLESRPAVLTTACRTLLEKLTVIQPIKIFPPRPIKTFEKPATVRSPSFKSIPSLTTYVERSNSAIFWRSVKMAVNNNKQRNNIISGSDTNSN